VTHWQAGGYVKQASPFSYGDPWQDLRFVYPDPPKAVPFTECRHTNWLDSSRVNNGPMMAECPDCGLRWFVLAQYAERRPIPWGCFKMVHIGRDIQIPLIDR
jgi:hypothetical protein